MSESGREKLLGGGFSRILHRAHIRMKQIPFFPNLPDGTHCYQAALKMALTYFTKKEWSYEVLDRLTQKMEGKWTWPTASFLWLLENGFEVKLIEEFNYLEFGRRGKAYLIEKCGKEVADSQEKNSDLIKEEPLALEFAKRGLLEYRIPSWDDFDQLFNDGYITICNINACKVYQQTGYSGHFVVPTSINNREIILHDPGLPAAPNLKVARALFEEAWGYPTEHEKNILAIRPV